MEVFKDILCEMENDNVKKQAHYIKIYLRKVKKFSHFKDWEIKTTHMK